MKESQREELTLYKDYADPKLYEKVMSLEPFRARGAARGVYVMISMKYDLPEDMTPAYMKRLDAGLKRDGSSLSEIVNSELKRAIEAEENFEKYKDDESFKKAYAEYAANPDRCVID